MLSEESLEIAINDFMSTTTQFSEWYKQWVDNIQGSTSNKKRILFDEVFNSPNFKDAKEKLLELATSGELTPKTISSTEEYKKLIDQTGLSAEKLAEKIKKFNIDDKSSNIDYLEVYYLIWKPVKPWIFLRYPS